LLIKVYFWSVSEISWAGAFGQSRTRVIHVSSVMVDIYCATSKDAFSKRRLSSKIRVKLRLDAYCYMAIGARLTL